MRQIWKIPAPSGKCADEAEHLRLQASVACETLLDMARTLGTTVGPGAAVSLGLLLALGVVGGCLRRAAESVTSVPPEAGASLTIPEEAARSGDGGEAFLVLTAGGDVVLRTRDTAAGRVLAQGAQNALYDATLELVWIEADTLRVVDLREPDSAPVVIATGWPGAANLTVTHPASTVSADETCDVGYSATLSWTNEPRLDVLSVSDGTPVLVGQAWLQAQATRTPRALSDPHQFDLRFEQARVAVPAKLADCLEPEHCGRAVRFGAHPLELVLAVTLQGDCWHPYCLFRDPSSGAFSAPVLGNAWRGPADRAGPCGLFLFDRGGLSFLVGDRLCGPDERCVALGGRGLGWRDPGQVVGAPSDFLQAPPPGSD